jgi:hypothetical protein
MLLLPHELRKHEELEQGVHEANDVHGLRVPSPPQQQRTDASAKQNANPRIPHSEWGISDILKLAVAVVGIERPALACVGSENRERRQAESRGRAPGRQQGALQRRRAPLA